MHGCVRAQSCPTLRPHGLCSLPGSFVHGIFQARILEWVAVSFSRGNLPDSGMEPTGHLLHWQADFLSLAHVESPK